MSKKSVTYPQGKARRIAANATVELPTVEFLKDVEKIDTASICRATTRAAGKAWRVLAECILDMGSDVDVKAVEVSAQSIMDGGLYIDARDRDEPSVHKPEVFDVDIEKLELSFTMRGNRCRFPLRRRTAEIVIPELHTAYDGPIACVLRRDIDAWAASFSSMPEGDVQAVIDGIREYLDGDIWIDAPLLTWSPFTTDPPDPRRRKTRRRYLLGAVMDNFNTIRREGI